VEAEIPGEELLIREAFKVCGYRRQLSFAKSACDVRRLVSTQRFDLMLSDFGADVERGVALIRFVRKYAPLLPIVVLSMHPDVRPAYEAGVNAFVRKATDLDGFFRQICEIMHFWVELAELPREQTHALVQSAYSIRVCRGNALLANQCGPCLEIRMSTRYEGALQNAEQSKPQQLPQVP
jgi:DNA-binding NtrC family response regulator